MPTFKILNQKLHFARLKLNPGGGPHMKGSGCSLSRLGV